MRSETRSKMVAGAADLLSRRGVNATSVREVVRHTETPRGSIGHHFPRGKQQLLEEALSFAGREVSVPLEKLMAEQGAIAGLRAFVGLWRDVLQRSRYEAGCPVLAVAIEQYIGEDGMPSPDVQLRLLQQASDIFDEWRRIIYKSLLKERVPSARARRLAALVVAAVEGTVAMCRAAKSSKPLDEVCAELELAITMATNQKP